jgi:hypothetical protein
MRPAHGAFGKKFSGRPYMHAEALTAFHCGSFLMNSSSVAGRPPALGCMFAIAFDQFGLWLGVYATLKILLPL